MADIMTPALGESVTEATVARWTKKAGDAVRKDEILVELETDKVSLEVAAPSDGTLSEISAEEGATVVISDKHERRLGEAAGSLQEAVGRRPLAVACLASSTSARSSTSAPKGRSTSVPSGPSRMSMPAISNG